MRLYLVRCTMVGRLVRRLGLWRIGQSMLAQKEKGRENREEMRTICVYLAFRVCVSARAVNRGC